jgi:Tol biopolymer transport system component
MKWLNCEEVKVLLVVFVSVFMLGGGSAKADFTFGEPLNMGQIINSSVFDTSPCISPDSLELYFASERSGGSGGDDLYVTTRPKVIDPWGEPMNLGQTVNSSFHDWKPSISTDGLSLYFTSGRSGGYGGYSDIWMTTRITKDDPWKEPEPLGPTINSSGYEGHPSISADGLMLYFSSDKAGGFGSDDIWVSTRQTTEDEWDIPVNLGPIVNSSTMDGWIDVCSNNCVLFFSSNRSGNWDIWMTTRKTTEEDWGEPVNLGSPVNTSAIELGSSISSDGSMLYFHSTRPGGYGSRDLWQAPIIPIVDFNSDGNIDTDDLLIMINNWGTDESLCDIGPMPWGDGVVDIEDLKVFIKYWEQENIPQTTENGE